MNRPDVRDQKSPFSRNSGKRRRQAATAALAAVALLLSAACSLDYGSVSQAESIPADLPQTVIYDFSHTVVSHGRPSIRVFADRAEEFTERKTTNLEGVSFIEYDGTGTPITTGTAGNIVFHTDTENAELSDQIIMHSKREDATISAREMTWNRGRKVLTALPEDPVTIERRDGTVITGQGFQADAQTRSITYAGGASGTYVYESKKK